MFQANAFPQIKQLLLPNDATQQIGVQNILTDQDTSPAISIGPEKQINASSLHNYITGKMNQESYLGNSFHGIPKHNIHQQNFQQGNNYFYPMMQHSKNSPSNKR